MSQPIRVLFANHVGGFDAGGGERYCSTFYATLIPAPSKFYWQFPQARTGDVSAALPAHIERFEHYIPLVNTPGTLLLRLFLTLVLYPIEVGRLTRIVLTEKIDVLYANSLLSAFYLALVSRLTNRPLIYHEHNFVEQRTRRGFLFAFNWVTATATRIVAISESVARSVERFGVEHDKITVVHNGIDYQPVDRQTAETMATQGYHRLSLHDRRRPIVGMVANFHTWKGHDLVLQTAPIIKANFPDVLYVFVGRPTVPEYYASLVEYVKGHNLENNVRFLGFQEQVDELMAAMDCLIVASNPEPFGMVVLEGMQLYKPIIALNRGGPAEILENGRTGLLIEPDVCEMATAITKLLSAPGLRRTLGEAGNSVLQKQFLVKFQASKLMTLIREVSLSQTNGREELF